MKNFSSFQDFIIPNNQTISIEGGESPVPVVVTVLEEVAKPKTKTDKVAHFQGKIAEVKSSTKFNTDQKAKLTEVFTKHVTKLKA